MDTTELRALLDAGYSYESVARRLRIAPGLVYMLATGAPADGSDDPHPDEQVGRAARLSSPQRLVNPAQHNPTRKPFVLDWVKRRAARDLTARDG
jgi:hypothetical protein